MAPVATSITTVYDGEDFLAEAIASLRAQTLEDLQIIVVVDGATDGSEKLAREQAAEDPRVEVVVMPRIGRSAALNVGLARVRSPFVAILDADDLAHPRRLELQHAWLAASPPSVGLVGSAEVRFHGSTGLLPALADGATASPDVTAALRRHNPLAHSSVLFRTSALEAVGGYDPSRVRQVDYDIYVRLAAAGYRIHRMDQRLIGLRTHPGQNYLAGRQGRYRLSSLGVQRSALRHVEGPPIDVAYFVARAGLQLARSVLPGAVADRLRSDAPIELPTA